MQRIMTAGLMAGLMLVTPAVAQDATTTPAAAEAATPDYDAATVVATVNGTAITLGHVIALQDQLPPQYRELPDDVLMTGIVDQLVDQTLLASLASATPESDPLAVRLQLDNERRGALAGRAAESAVADAADEAKVKAAHDKLVAEFKPQAEFNASHILVDSEEKAAGLKTEVDGGADFAELAKANSSDGSAANGGELGWFGAGMMVPEFETAVQGMEVGAVAGPIKTQFGWHLIRLNEKRETAAPALDEARGEIENQLRQEALQAKLAELRERAEIEMPETKLPAEAIRQSELLTD